MAEHPLGRDQELVRLDAFVTAIAGRSAGLFLEGPAGIGKTTLVTATLDEARRRGIRTLVARPSGAEATFAYTALADLLADALTHPAVALPPAQRMALDAALLRSPATEPAADGHLVGVAVHSILTTLARERPVLVAVDDVGWLDHATDAALRFAIRRLASARVGWLATQRADEPGIVPLDLERTVTTERMWVGPLGIGALHLLLATRLGLTLSRATLAQLHEAAQGNPLHALEIGRALQRHPTRPRPGDPLPIPASIRELIGERIDPLSADASALLLATATAGSADLDALVGVVERSRDALDTALDELRDAGLVTVEDGRLRVAHPLIATAAAERVPPSVRRRTHSRLAEVATSAESRARHLALGTVGASGELADALDRASIEARSRGAIVEASELARLALERTPEDAADASARRRVALAHLLFDLPDLGAARELLEATLPLLPPGHLRAEARMIAGTVEWYVGPSSAAVGHLVAALDDATGDDELLGRIHYRLALFLDLDFEGARRHAERAVALIDPATAPTTLAAAMFTLFSSEVALGHPPRLDLLEAGLKLEGADNVIDRSTLPGIWWVAIDRHDLARDRFMSMLEQDRAAGSRAGEPDLLTRLATTELHAGDWRRARAYADEAAIVAEQEGQSTPSVARRVRALIDAHEGRVDSAIATAAEALARAEADGELLLAIAHLHTLVHAHAFAGHPAEVVSFALRSAELRARIGLREPLRLDATPELVEALVALGELDAAEPHLEDLEARGRVVPRPWVEAAVVRGRALLLAARGRLPEAIEITEPVIDERSAAWPRLDRGRTWLVRGTVLRRARARRDAAAALQAAIELLDGLGAAGLAERARAELERLGRTRAAGQELTPAERRIARLAASGLRNHEVAQELGISAKTVEAHLARAYDKLGIRSRAELGRRMADDGERAS